MAALRLTEENISWLYYYTSIHTSMFVIKSSSLTAYSLLELSVPKFVFEKLWSSLSVSSLPSPWFDFFLFLCGFLGVATFDSISPSELHFSASNSTSSLLADTCVL